MNILTRPEADSAAKLRGYTTREMPVNGSRCFWRCQIGKTTFETKTVSQDRRTHVVNGCEFFRLVAFGETWGDAVKALEGVR